MSAEKSRSILSTLRNSRVRVDHNGETIVNLSLLFCLIAVLCAPWLAVGSAVAAMALDYRFSYTPADQNCQG